MDKFKKLINSKNFIWLFKIAKPFFGTIIVIIITSMVISTVGIGAILVSKEMVDSAITDFGFKTVTYIIIFISAQVFILIISSFMSRILVKLKEKMSYMLQNNILRSVYKSDWIDQNRFHSGDILTRLTDDIDNVVSLWVSTIPGIITLGLQLLLAFFLLYYYDSRLALLAFILSPIAILASFLLGLRIKKLQHQVQAVEGKYRSFITELVQHLLIVKSFQYEKKSLTKVKEMQDKKYECAVKRNKMGITANMVLSGGYWAGYALAFVYGILKLAKKATTFGTFTAFIQLVDQVQSPFMGLASSMPQLLSSFASVERLTEIEELVAEEALTSSEEFNLISKFSISLKDVVFGYNEEKNVLSGSSFKADSGSITALIGSSGEGKTTIMRLLLGLIKPNEGEIYISADKADKIIISAATRGYFSYVPQGNTLFSGTVRDNIIVGKTDSSEEELVNALKAACAWGFVQELPDKLDTVIGESGVGLSEGQAQRLCIGRALIRPAPILLFDEATSALDMETERKIFENIRGMGNKTCIVITHRLSVLPLCDAVYRLENGKLHKHETRDFKTILHKEEVS